MEDLQRNHKELAFTVVKYFQIMFASVLHQNKNDPEKIRYGLLNVVNHAFGTHDNCGKSWRGFLQNPQTYKHKGLPYGRDLCGEAKKVDLTNLFKVSAENAEKLAPLPATNHKKL